MIRETVVFDIDGTLIDSVDFHAKAWQETLAQFGFDVAFDEVRAQIGKGGDQLLPCFVPRDVLAKKQDTIEAFRADLFKRKYMPLVRPFPAVRPLFERIKADRRRIALASSAKQDELEVYKRLADIQDLVDVETSADDVERSKPKPDIFDAVLRKLNGGDQSSTIVVGDSPYDAIAAGRAGLQTVGVLCGGFREEDLRRAGCVAVYRDPHDLLENYPDALS